MTYIRSKMINGSGPYFYEVKSVREGDKVKQVFVKYLGTTGPTGSEPAKDLGTTEKLTELEQLEKDFKESQKESARLLFEKGKANEYQAELRKSDALWDRMEEIREKNMAKKLGTTEKESVKNLGTTEKNLPKSLPKNKKFGKIEYSLLDEPFLSRDTAQARIDARHAYADKNGMERDKMKIVEAEIKSPFGNQKQFGVYWTYLGTTEKEPVKYLGTTIHQGSWDKTTFEDGSIKWKSGIRGMTVIPREGKYISYFSRIDPATGNDEDRQSEMEWNTKSEAIKGVTKYKDKQLGIWK